MQTRTNTTYRRQQGSALIIGLIIVLMMTLLGITTLRTTVLQERMAGNERDMNVAFQAAEAALREVIASNTFASQTYDGTQAGYGPQITAFMDGSNPVSEFTYWTTVFDWSSKGLAATKPTGASEAPMYYVERTLIPPAYIGAPIKHLYKITVRGKGASTRAEAIVQGTKLVE